MFLRNIQEALPRPTEHVEVSVVDVEPQRMQVYLVRLQFLIQELIASYVL